VILQKFGKYTHLGFFNRNYAKNLKFPNQHAVNHIITKIRRKGTTTISSTNDYGTRVGERFQQESAQALWSKNGKNEEAQASLFKDFCTFF
jgi:hypothetical protein